MFDSLQLYQLQLTRLPCPSLFCISQRLLRLLSIVLMMPSNYLILWCPLVFLPSIFLSIRIFSNESVLCIRWSNYWSFSLSISPSNEYSGLISFRIDWFYLLAVQGTLKSLLEHHNSKPSILWCSALFMVQHSHLSRRCGAYIQWNITQPSKRMKWCHLQQHG